MVSCLRAVGPVVVLMLLAPGLVLGEPSAPAPSRPWAFTRPEPSPLPPVANDARVENEIDRFLLARLEERGLSYAPEASRVRLLRRVTFDLIGLPPTPEELDAFLRDDDPRAYEKVVDRLLADPRYGERWARRWLDLARYADTAGYEGDPDLPHAWRYRDYVIDAFNGDKPFDRFIREQIAGDEFHEVMGAGELPEPEPEHVVALTFLRLAPFTEPRGDESRHEFLSEMTSTVSSVFLGLTMGCAQCHDHKYDDIPARDFYRLQAFFSTVSMPRPEPGDGFQLGGPIAAEFYRPGEKEWAANLRDRFRREVGTSKSELEQLKTKLVVEKGAAGFGIQACGGSLGNDYVFDRRAVHDGELHTSIVNSDGSSWSFFTDAGSRGSTGRLAGRNSGAWYGDLRRPRSIGLGAWTEGADDAAPTEGKSHVGHVGQVLVYDHPLDERERSALAAWVAAVYGGSDAGGEDTGIAPEPPTAGLRFWLDARDLDAQPSTPNPKLGAAIAEWRDKVSGIVLRSPKDDLRPELGVFGKARAPAVLFDGDYLRGEAARARFLDDQTGALVVVYSARFEREGYSFEVGGDGQFISSVMYPSRGSQRSVAFDAPDSPLTRDERRRYRWLERAEYFLEQRIRRLRPVAMSLRHSYGPPFEPGVPVTRVKIRGEWNHPGEAVEAGFPVCIEGAEKPAKIRLDPFKRWPTRSRRMALARWIASPENPLTARVYMNRLWLWHFGRGIVPTPSDFGVLSGGPSHPELLDWLALRFVEEKWKTKPMHRLIVTSAAYRQDSSYHDDRAFELDPKNRLHWRFRRQRLEAEAVRDAILAASGRLNPESFGLPIFPPLPDGLEERVKYSESKWDTMTGPESRKRSIYIYQQRTLSMPMMQIFDAVVCDASRPARRASVTPLQALTLYNGELTNEEARHFAERVRAQAGDDLDAQVAAAFRIAFSRPPTEGESRRFVAFLSETEGASPKRPDRLVGLCRILYNANEFVYVD